VQDDGIGFEAAQVPPDSVHVGLGIMRERAQRIGAVVQVHSQAGQGTRVCIELPSSPRPPAPAATPTPALVPAAPAVHQELLT
jgi:two-component system nitrate/nitrite sensor histidine kinase NarX